MQEKLLNLAKKQLRDSFQAGLQPRTNPSNEYKYKP